ncbi:MOSC domain-containing protein [Sphingomonas bacterium]|uniref:MOSC domain-containing protein n=1 Tax=Sphingomonas bacterium TaxID=1895847 RepID=UPI00157511E2|nr:MOSC N-terminal beta barrel domain-containing protein [Sphingomonas bacterium]
MQLSSIHCFPVKGLGGCAMTETPIEARGIAGDRRWMIIDQRNRFVTRREVPAMASLNVTPSRTGLTIRSATESSHAIMPGDEAPLVDARVWRDTVSVRVGNDAADAFLSEALGRPVRLAHQHDSSRRAIDPRYSRPDDHVSLADGFPLLITTMASLDALNDRLAVPVTMARFRSNLVIADAAPWQEDRWRRIRIGAVEMEIARPCSRCIVVTQQPDTGERLEGNEPLATLRAMGRLAADGIMFGQNAIIRRPGTLSIGDRVEVIEEGDSRPAPASR